MSNLDINKKRFLSEGIISNQLPKSLPNGSTFSEYTGECNGCGNELPRDMLRGVVNKPLPNVIDVDAIGCCRNCMTIFPLRTRMKEYKTQTFLEYQINGRWVRTDVSKPESKTTLKTVLKRWAWRIFFILK